MKPDRHRSYLDGFEQHEDKYLELFTEFKDGINRYQNNNSVSESVPPEYSRIQLERLMIPKFDRHYSQWRTFYDLLPTILDKNQELRLNNAALKEVSN